MSVSELIRSNIGLYSAIFFFTLLAIEIVAIKLFRARGRIPAKDASLGVLTGVLSDPVNALSAFITLGILSMVEPYQMASLPVTLTTFVLCFILDDLRFYCHHRVAHRCRWVWAMHVVHHSSQEYNLAVALRQGWTKHFTGTMLFKVPLVLVGFDPVMVTFCGVLNASYQFLLHTETVDKMPRWYEFIFNTPSHHRVHHANNPRYLDTNYAGTLIIWDRMFGSFAAEDRADPPVYGLVKDLNTFNLFTILTHEYFGIARDVVRRGLTMTQRFCYIFAPPGWSHDGSRLSTEAIKRAAGIGADPQSTPPPPSPAVRTAQPE
ncbi:sterol desaturase family protein [Sphingomonas lacunae]|uniref:Sterol desaturase family protein n=1 Tax=Sphingomonas lacunae TaxID=2698828 RepID=A0A6M4AUA6_9SPHN|nr:sterol desaturase family protein [Sphingomonas lacunae]QJQ31609.1 sterol desaturase family protein [Sphingomonas lacunae]